MYAFSMYSPWFLEQRWLSCQLSSTITSKSQTQPCSVAIQFNRCTYKSLPPKLIQVLRRHVECHENFCDLEIAFEEAKSSAQEKHGDLREAQIKRDSRSLQNFFVSTQSLLVQCEHSAHVSVRLARKGNVVGVETDVHCLHKHGIVDIHAWATFCPSFDSRSQEHAHSRRLHVWVYPGDPGSLSLRV